MPWPTKKLGEVCNSLGGGTPRRSNPDYFKGDIPWITVTDLTDELRLSRISNARQHITKEAIESSATNLVPAGSVILTTRVAVGKVGLATRPITTNQDCTSFIPHKEIMSEFLAVWFLSNRNVIKSLSRGIGIMGVRRKDLENLEIPLPPIAEQKRIVAKIEKLFAKIDEASRLRAESSAASAALLPSTLYQVFSSAKKGNWPTKKLGDPDVCTIVMGQSPPGITYNTSDNGLPFYQGKKDFGPLHPTPSVWCNAPLKIAEANDVLISVRAPVGPVNLCREKSAIGRGLAALRANPKNLYYRFLFLFLKSIESNWEIPGGAVFGAITKKNLENLEIPLPPLAEQRKIVAYLDSLSAKTRELQKLQTETAADFSALRKSVLAKAFAGA